MHFPGEEREGKAVSHRPLSFCAGRVSATQCYRAWEGASLHYPAAGQGRSAEPRAAPGCSPFCVPQTRGTKGEATEATESTFHSAALLCPLMPIHLLPDVPASLRLEVHLWPWHSPSLGQAAPRSVFWSPDVLSGLQQAGRLVKMRQCYAYHCHASAFPRSRSFISQHHISLPLCLCTGRKVLWAERDSSKEEELAHLENILQFALPAGPGKELCVAPHLLRCGEQISREQLERRAFSVDTAQGGEGARSRDPRWEGNRKTCYYAFYTQSSSPLLLFPLKERKGKDDSCPIPQLSLEAALV